MLAIDLMLRACNYYNVISLRFVVLAAVRNIAAAMSVIWPPDATYNVHYHKKV